MLSLKTILNSHSKNIVKTAVMSAAAIGFTLITSCSSNLDSGDHLFERENYIGAIENYDLYLQKGKKSVRKTYVENKRSDAYYRLGMQALEENNPSLAIRFFYLANFLKADEKLVETYLKITQDYKKSNEFDKALTIYDYIIDTFPTLPVIPGVIEEKIVLLHEHKRPKDEIWRNYTLLADRYGHDNLDGYIVDIIDTYMKSFIEETIARKTEDNRLEVIDKLLYFEEYPNSYHKRIRSEVGTIYYEMGLVAEKQLKYFDAEKLFRLSSQYNPELEAQVTSELNGMVGKMINYGNNLLKERKVAEALKIYQLTFSILPDNPSAHNAIKIAEEKKASIEEAKAISLKAEQSEKDKKYQEAFNLYKQAYAKDPIKEYSDKVFTMESLIEIEKDAVGFARKIISSYNNGRITSSLRKIEETLRDNFGDDVNTSGWRIMLSTGTHRYEVRYDITSKGESFYFIWQVNLLTRQITPLNKESKEAME